jgi:hypothetical protein
MHPLFTVASCANTCNMAHVGMTSCRASAYVHDNMQQGSQHDNQASALQEPTLSNSSSGSMLRHGLVSLEMSGAAWLTQA